MGGNTAVMVVPAFVAQWPEAAWALDLPRARVLPLGEVVAGEGVEPGRRIVMVDGPARPTPAGWVAVAGGMGWLSSVRPAPAVVFNDHVVEGWRLDVRLPSWLAPFATLPGQHRVPASVLGALAAMGPEGRTSLGAAYTALGHGAFADAFAAITRGGPWDERTTRKWVRAVRAWERPA